MLELRINMRSLEIHPGKRRVCSPPFPQIGWIITRRYGASQFPQLFSKWTLTHNRLVLTEARRRVKKQMIRNGSDGSSNGRTRDFGSRYLGSNPSPSASFLYVPPLAWNLLNIHYFHDIWGIIHGLTMSLLS